MSYIRLHLAAVIVIPSSSGSVGTSSSGAAAWCRCLLVSVLIGIHPVGQSRSQPRSQTCPPSACWSVAAAAAFIRRRSV